MSAVAAEKKKPFMAVGPGSSALTNAQCTPFTVHYAYNTIALANGTGSAVVSEGGKTWYFLTADYAFGHSLEQDTAKVVESNEGKVLGAVRAPISTTDFSSFLLQAQSSGAEVLGLANAGGDFINSVKAAKEFGITNSMKLAGLLVFINDVHALGLENTAGLYLTTAWYWNQDDESRAWAKRFFDQHNRAPSFLQAGDYSVTKTYLESVKATGTDDGETIMSHLKSIEINDMFMKKGHIRADGLTMHDMYLAQVKTPDQSKAPWDYYNIVKTLPAEAVYGPLSSSTCPLLKK